MSASARSRSKAPVGDVASLRDLPNEIKGLPCGALDPRLIAIAYADGQAIVLDYRAADEPRVCLSFFGE